MDFLFTAEQRAFRDSIARFARDELNHNLVDRDEDGWFDRGLWVQCAKIGIQGLPIPVEYGGGAADSSTLVMALETLGYSCRDNGLIFSLNAHMWSCSVPILVFGTKAQRRQYLPGMCNGTLIGVQAMTEPDTGSDALNMSTTAVRHGREYVLNGVKTFITNAPVADVFVVFARTDPDVGFMGVSAFLVDRDSPGLAVGRPMRKMGLRTSPMSEVVLRDCVVPRDALLADAGAGWTIFNTAMEWERSFILASAVGTMRRHLECAVRYARERHQFGKPIGSFQAVSHRIVDMYLRVETARMLLHRLAVLRDRGESTAGAAALVKLHLSECLVQSSLDTMQVFGGYGYLTDQELEREVRDALGSRIYSGTSDLQRAIVARELGL